MNLVKGLVNCDNCPVSNNYPNAILDRSPNMTRWQKLDKYPLRVLLEDNEDECA